MNSFRCINLKKKKHVKIEFGFLSIPPLPPRVWRDNVYCKTISSDFKIIIIRWRFPRLVNAVANRSVPIQLFASSVFRNNRIRKLWYSTRAVLMRYTVDHNIFITPFSVRVCVSSTDLNNKKKKKTRCSAM